MSNGSMILIKMANRLDVSSSLSSLFVCSIRWMRVTIKFDVCFALMYVFLMVRHLYYRVLWIPLSILWLHLGQKFVHCVQAIPFHSFSLWNCGLWFNNGQCINHLFIYVPLHVKTIIGSLHQLKCQISLKFRLSC